MQESDLIKLIYNAAAEYKKLTGKSFLFISYPRNGAISWFECHFEPKQFVHLIAIKSTDSSDFFNRCCKHFECEDTGISADELIPARGHKKSDIYSKVQKAKPLFEIQNAKYMRVGEKDKITQYVDFSFAYGADAIIGFQKDQFSSFPITLMERNISEFCTHPQRITFILAAEAIAGRRAGKYKEIIVEKSKGLLRALYDSLPDKLRNMIAADCADLQLPKK